MVHSNGGILSSTEVDSQAAWDAKNTSNEVDWLKNRRIVHLINNGRTATTCMELWAMHVRPRTTAGLKLHAKNDAV